VAALLLMLAGLTVPAATSPVAAQAITEYPIPTANSYPFSITAGPDGALWFTENAANKIGRITTGGVVTEYPIPTANASPTDIAAGSDGALWFTESGAYKIGRISTSGVITEYPLPTTQLPASGPLGPGETSFADTAAPPGLACYLLLPLGTNPQAMSDLLCAAVGSHTATGVPESLILRLNQSSTASLSWTAPSGQTPDSYLLLTPGGAQLDLGGGATFYDCRVQIEVAAAA